MADLTPQPRADMLPLEFSSGKLSDKNKKMTYKKLNDQ
jgi:hypothetical protein